MKHISFFKLLYFTASFALMVTSCAKTGASKPGGNDHDSTGVDPRVSLTTPATHTGDVPYGPDPDPQPQPANILAPFAGVWQNDQIVLVFLTDGRTACLNTSSGAVPAEVGTYSISSNTMEIRWMFSDVEKEYTAVKGNTLTFDIYDFQRTGDANAALARYNQIYSSLVTESEGLAKRFPVGKVNNSAADPSDPNPAKVITNANVYIGNGLHFVEAFYSSKWYQMPDNKINGYDGYSRADIWLLPNGRFCSEMWLWKSVDDRSYEHTSHYISWGKYTVIKGSNALTGDIINFYYDNGGTEAYKTVGGQRHFITKNIHYHNIIQ